MTTNGQFNWNELQTGDADRAIEFYAASVGWTFEAEQMPSGGTYWLCMASGQPVGGILTVADDEPDRWVTFIHVDSLDDAVTRVSDLGGDVLRAPWDVPGVGRIAMIRDPGGAEVGLVEPV